MPNEKTIVKKILTNYKQRRSFFDYTNELRKINKLDVLINFGSLSIAGGYPIEVKDYTLLMFYTVHNDIKNVKILLNGNNPANVSVTNEAGQSALYLAVFLACEKPAYNAVVDELLKHTPERQAGLQEKNNGYTPLSYAVIQRNLHLTIQLAAIDNKKQFLAKLNSTGVTPLCYAIEKNLPIEFSQTLLKYYPEEQLLCASNSGWLPIHWACWRGNLQIVQQLMQIRTQEQMQTKTQVPSVIDLVIASDNKELLEWMLDNFPDSINLLSIDNVSPLHRACMKNSLWAVKLLLEKGADAQLVLPDKMGFIPLSYVCQNDNSEIVIELLKENTIEQLKWVEPDGYTPLFRAVYYGNLKVLKAIIQTIKVLSLEETLLVKNEQNRTALMIAISTTEKNSNYLLIIDELLQLIPIQQLEMTDSEGLTPVHWAAQENKPEVLAKFAEYLKVKHYLAEKNNGAIPLYCAAQEGFVKVVNALVDNGPMEQLYVKYQGWLPIHIAANNNHFGTVNKLYQIDNKMVHATTTEGLTPLHLAAYAHAKITLQGLLKFNANRLQPDHSQFLPIHYAAQEGNHDAVNYLLSERIEEQLTANTNEKTTPLHLAIMANQTHCVELLLETAKKYNLTLHTARDLQGFTPLHSACFYGYLEAFSALLEDGANVEAEDDNQWRPLHIICFKGYIHLFNLIMEKKVNLDTRNNLGATALHIASEKGHLKLVKKLVETNKELMHIRDHSGLTPLFSATIFGHSNIVEYLAHEGADVNVAINMDDQIVTPLMTAVECIDISMIKTLVRNQANIMQNLSFSESLTVIDLVEQEQDKDIREALLKALNRSGSNLSKFASLKSGFDIQDTTQQAAENVTKREDKSFHHSLLDKSSWSGRAFLTGAGFTKEQLDAIEKDRKKKKANLKEKKYSGVVPKEDNRKVISWFGGAFDSTHADIYPIRSPNVSQVFCYLDKALLEQQGCDISHIETTKFKFNNKSIKKLSNNKSIFKDNMRINGEVREITYSHEIKITKMDRILVFEYEGLYIGSKYAQNGLHIQASIRNILESTKNKKILQITLPHEQAITRKTIFDMEEIWIKNNCECIQDINVFLIGDNHNKYQAIFNAKLIEWILCQKGDLEKSITFLAEGTDLNKDNTSEEKMNIQKGALPSGTQYHSTITYLSAKVNKFKRVSGWDSKQRKSLKDITDKYQEKLTNQVMEEIKLHDKEFSIQIEEGYLPSQTKYGPIIQDIIYDDVYLKNDIDFYLNIYKNVQSTIISLIYETAQEIRKFTAQKLIKERNASMMKAITLWLKSKRDKNEYLIIEAGAEHFAIMNDLPADASRPLRDFLKQQQQIKFALFFPKEARKIFPSSLNNQFAEHVIAQVTGIDDTGNFIKEIIVSQSVPSKEYQTKDIESKNNLDRRRGVFFASTRSEKESMIKKECLDKLITLTSLGQKTAVKQFIENVVFVDVNMSDDFGNCAVLVAAERNELDMLKLLVGFGANLDVKDKDEYTPLKWAEEYKNQEMKKFIIQEMKNKELQYKLNSEK